MRNGRRDVKMAGTWMALLALAVAWQLAPFARAQAQTANLVENGDAEAGTLDNWTGFTKVVSQGAHSGTHCFSRTGVAHIKSKQIVPVDFNKTYTLSGWMKSVGQGQSTVYLGLIALDKNKHEIAPCHVYCIPATETTLAQACKKEDKVVRIADGGKWKGGLAMCIAFAVDDSGQFGDLPNRNVSSIGITKIEKEGDCWAVHLAKECGRAYPAGTKIREHSSGGTYIYCAASCKPVPMEWTQFKGTVKGMSKSAAPANQWWPGTKYAKVFIYANYRQGKEFEVLVDDIMVIEE